MLKINKYSMSIRFKDQYPYYEKVLSELLTDNGFESKYDPSIISIDPQTGARIDTVIFKNKNISIASQNKRGVIGINADKSKECIDGIKQLVGFFKENEELGIDIETDIKFLEVILEAIWFSKKTWHAIFSQYKHEKYSLFSDFFKEDVDNYSIRISAVIPEEYLDKSIQECANFFELIMAPLNSNPKRVGVNYVYRKSNINNVIEFNNNIEDKLTTLFTKMEGN